MNAQVKKILAPIASLRLTVALFALAMFLILAGTVAQVNQGIYEVTRLYFHSLFVWIPLNIFVPALPEMPGLHQMLSQISGHIPFPGGYTLGGILLLNLIAAHIIRFKPGIKRIGMWMIHGGIILLILGELFTSLLAYEGNMSIDEGSSSNFTENLHLAELAIIDTSPAEHDKIIAISENAIRKSAGKQLISDPRLPFDIKVDQWMSNSSVFGTTMAPAGFKPASDSGLGSQLVVRPEKVVSGVDASKINAPSAIVSFLKDGENLGQYLLSINLGEPEKITVGDHTYDVILRLERRYKPYSLHLKKFTHETFTGTETPRNFASEVRLVDPTQNEDREVKIWMNHPLRYAGETFYQASYKPDGSGTILQVVDNPSWMLPYISCTIITLGMTIHFCIHLFGFVRRTRK